MRRFPSSPPPGAGSSRPSRALAQRGRSKVAGSAGGPVACALLLGLGAAGCRAEQGSVAQPVRAEVASPPGARIAELYFTTGTSGYIEPCGCTSRPLGGLPRLATVLARGAEARALVDAGQLLLPASGLDELTRPQHLEKARLLARAYRKLGAVALNLAPSDLLAGSRFLAELQHEGAVPFVSANVRPRGDRGPEVARSRIRVLGGIRFGITGLAIPERVAAVSEDVAALELAPAVQAEVEALREGGAEIIIVLGHLPEADARVLAEMVPGIDVLFRAPGTTYDRPPRPPLRVGATILAEAGQQGQYLGRARFVLGAGAPKSPLPLDDAGAKALEERALLERRIAALDREIARFQVDPTRSAEAEARRALRDRLALQLERPLPPRAPPEGPHVEVTVLPLDTSIPEADGVRRLLAAYYQRLRDMNLQRADPSACALEPDDAPRFVGNARCSQCHAEAYEFWLGTAHARAWETLERDAKHYDLTCVGCHVVGFRQPGGFCRLSDAEPFRDVGCESCHGPGSLHVASPVAGSIGRGASEATCAATCHVPEHSDRFVYESYVRKITGPGHPLGEGS